MRKPLIAGNWKMNKTVVQATELVEGLLEGVDQPQDREVLVCPPFTALHAVGQLVEGSPIMLGAQNLYPQDSGAYTGEVSSPMLLEVGCSYVILGHSERRGYFGEEDEFINQKIKAALGAGLKAILCVGESREQREAGQADRVVSGQVRSCLADLTPEDMAQVVIAYEPIWAIGTGLTAEPEDAQEMHASIRSLLSELFDEQVAGATRILYGGSVKPWNVDDLMAQPDIDGGLVGGASLEAESFLRIIHFISS
ncbi:MAG: triose-phosphate isomerase [Chloroflexota bacterium]|nr:triose-phosphate isomerase [Chloroflexota bacterium]